MFYVKEGQIKVNQRLSKTHSFIWFLWCIAGVKTHVIAWTNILVYIYTCIYIIILSLQLQVMVPHIITAGFTTTIQCTQFSSPYISAHSCSHYYVSAHSFGYQYVYAHSFRHHYITQFSRRKRHPVSRSQDFVTTISAHLSSFLYKCIQFASRNYIFTTP